MSKDKEAEVIIDRAMRGLEVFQATGNRQQFTGVLDEIETWKRKNNINREKEGK